MFPQLSRGFEDYLDDVMDESHDHIGCIHSWDEEKLEALRRQIDDAMDEER